MSYEERIRALEEALAVRDRSVAQLTQRLAQAEAEYQQVCGAWDCSVAQLTQRLAQAKTEYQQVWGAIREQRLGGSDV